MALPLVAVTMGDPAGVGPEICLRLLASDEVRTFAVPFVFGDAAILRDCARATGLPAPERVLALADWEKYSDAPVAPAVLDIPGFDATGFRPGNPDARTGAAGYRYVIESIRAALAGRVDAVATGPLNKEALRAAGVRHPGHTEIFTAETGASRSCMFQYSEEVRASFVTVHVGYAEVPALLTRERILEVIQLTAEAVARLRPRAGPPKLAVLGLNPHAGEHGLFGEGEEERIIAPAIEEARGWGLEIEGPLPPDTAFLPSRRALTDAFVCLYHDQGHIPLKALAFDSAVNITLGLPIVRTSVDHGTACDIAWKGTANVGSLVEAVRIASRLVGGR